MLSFTPLLVSVSIAASSIDEVIRAHESNMACAVRISTTVSTGTVSSITTTEIWTDGFSQWRVWIVGEKGPTYKIFSNDKTIQFLDIKSNRYIESPFIKGGSVYDNIISVAGGIDPIAQIYLDARIGVRRFLRLFGDFQFTGVSGFPGEFEIVSPTLNARLKTFLKSKLIESLEMKSDQTTVKWVISSPELGLAQGISSVLPKDASKVNSFALIAEPTKTDSPQTDQLMSRSRTAYDAIQTAIISSKATLWTPAGNQIRTSSCSWERGKRIRFEVATDKPSSSFVASFDGKLITGFDRVKSKAFQGTATAKNVSKQLDMMGAQYEPMVICFIKGYNYWDRLIPAGANIKLIKTSAMVGKDKCRVTISTTSDGWTATIYIRESDFLIAKIERLLQPGMNTMYKESVTYTYQSINKPLPPSTWLLSIPKGIQIWKL